MSLVSLQACTSHRSAGSRPHAVISCSVGRSASSHGLQSRLEGCSGIRLRWSEKGVLRRGQGMGMEVSSGVGSGGRERLLPMSRAVEEADAVLLLILPLRQLYSKFDMLLYSCNPNAVYTLITQEGGEGGEPEREPPPTDWLMTGLLFLFPAIGGLLFGYDIGATSGALVSIKSAATSGTTWYDLSAFQSGAVVSASLLGALAGSAAAFVVGDRIGRRRELLLAAGLYGTAAVCMYSAGGLEYLLAGRALYGLGIGFCMHAAPAYIAETAPRKQRGLLISLKEGFIVIGILLGYLASYLLVDEMSGWRYMYGLPLLPAIILLAGMSWAPASPRWLLLSGAGQEEATAALSRARGRYGSDIVAVRAEVADMQRTFEMDGGAQTDLTAVLRPQYARPLAVGLSLMLFQQITGQPSVLYYASQIFADAGFAAGQEASGVAVGLGLFKLIMTGIAVATVDSVGRRPLLLGGVSGMLVALLGLATAQLALGGSVATWTSVAALLLYVGCYQVSFGPISWLIVGEVFPLAVRGPASALATVTNFGSNFLVSLALPTVQQAWGPGYTYLAFAAVAVLALTTIYTIVPETKGKSLEEIETMFAQQSKKSSSDTLIT